MKLMIIQLGKYGTNFTTENGNYWRHFLENCGRLKTLISIIALQIDGVLVITLELLLEIQSDNRSKTKHKLEPYCKFYFILLSKFDLKLLLSKTKSKSLAALFREEFSQYQKSQNYDYPQVSVQWNFILRFWLDSE